MGTSEIYDTGGVSWDRFPSHRGRYRANLVLHARNSHTNACMEYDGKEDPRSARGRAQRTFGRPDALADGALVDILNLRTNCIHPHGVCGPGCSRKARGISGHADG